MPLYLQLKDLGISDYLLDEVVETFSSLTYELRVKVISKKLLSRKFKVSLWKLLLKLNTETTTVWLQKLIFSTSEKILHKVRWRFQQPLPNTPGQTPSRSIKCNWILSLCISKPLEVPSEGRSKNGVKCLALLQDTSVTTKTRTQTLLIRIQCS